jgi:acetyl esterase/lipase
MSSLSLVDPELRDGLAAWPNLALDDDTLPAARSNLIAFIASAPTPPAPHTVVSEIRIPSAFGAHAVRVLAYRPIAPKGPLPVLLHLHGGGYVMGAPEMRDALHRLQAAELQCAIYSVDYRLAPEHRYPAALEDSYSVLRWLADNVGELGLDRERMGVKGESAGAGLAAALAIYARDKAGPKLAFQHLIYPMLDDRTAARTDLDPHVGEFVWTNAHNKYGWSALLGMAPGAADVSPYAAAARTKDFTGLPPTFIAVGGLDLFLDEDLAYARALGHARVPAELHVYPGAYHGFQAAIQSRVAISMARDSQEALRRALHG